MNLRLFVHNVTTVKIVVIKKKSDWTTLKNYLLHELTQSHKDSTIFYQQMTII